MVAEIKEVPHFQSELLALSLSTVDPIGWRATWITRQFLSEINFLPSYHVRKVVNALMDLTESNQREWLKTLDFEVIDEDLEGLIYDQCVQLWSGIHYHSALRREAFKVLHRFHRLYPELLEETKYLFSVDFLENLSPAIRKSIERDLKSLS